MYPDAVISVASHPKECMIASGGMNEDCTIRVWELGGASSPSKKNVAGGSNGGGADKMDVSA